MKMRRVAFLLAGCLVTLPAGAASQHLDVSIGLSRAGTSESEGSGTGVSVGAGFVLPVTGRVSFNLGLEYTERALVDQFTVFDARTVSTVKVGTTYLEIPLLVEVGLAPDSRVSPYFFAGPGIGLSVGCRVDGEVYELGPFGQTIGFSNVSSSCEEGGYPESESIQLDGRGGVGIRIGIGGGLGAVVAVTYSIGLTSIFPASDLKSRALIVRAGVSLPLQQ